jgi:hypothetical protein
MDSSHYDSPTFSTRDCSRRHAARQWGFKRVAVKGAGQAANSPRAIKPALPLE